MKDWRHIRAWTRDEMMKRVARFNDLERVGRRIAGQRCP